MRASTGLPAFAICPGLGLTRPDDLTTTGLPSSATNRDELGGIMGELERAADVSRRAAILDGAEDVRRHLCLELRELMRPASVSQTELARRIGTSLPAWQTPKVSTLARCTAAPGFELHFNRRRVREPAKA